MKVYISKKIYSGYLSGTSISFIKHIAFFNGMYVLVMINFYRVLQKSINCMLCWYTLEIHATQGTTTAMFEVLLVTGSA
jgi:hypothetical protein